MDIAMPLRRRAGCTFPYTVASLSSKLAAPISSPMMRSGRCRMSYQANVEVLSVDDVKSKGGLRAVAGGGLLNKFSMHNSNAFNN